MSVVSLSPIRQINHALKTLNPNEVRALADQDVLLGVLAADDVFAADVFGFLLPPGLTEERAREAGKRILRIAEEEDFRRATAGFAEPGVPHPPHFTAFDRMRPERAVKRILDDSPDDHLALARWFLPFREQVIERIIWKTARENALFTVATAIPNVVPSALVLPWAVGEFASDTAFLTMNQVRMAFQIAAAADHEVGYGEQKGQIGSIVAAAFGWRALARELVGKIPAGGGLVSKGLVSFAGTYAVGKSLDKFFRMGDRMTRAERNEHYADAYQKGRSVVEAIVERLKASRAAEPAETHA